MRIRQKRNLFLFLTVFLLSFVLTACTDKAAGTYTAEAKFADFLDGSILSEAKGYGIDSYGSFTVQFVLTLNPDKTYEIAFDKETFQNDLDTVLRAAVRSAFFEQLAQLGYSEDFYDLWANQSGYENFDGLVQTYLDMTSDSVETALFDVSHSGVWSRKGKTLFLDEAEIEILDDGSFELPSDYNGHSLTLHFNR